MKTQSSSTAAGLIAAHLMYALSLTGCAVPANTSESGIRLGDETLKQFKAGETTEAWLVAILGPPTSASVVEGVQNTSVYRYAVGESNSGLAALISGSGKRNTAVTYFIITDGIVTRFWADRATEHTLIGTPVEQPTGEKK